MALIQRKLHDFENHLKAINHFQLVELNNGLNEFDIKQLLTSVSLPINEEIIYLYSWRNGVSFDNKEISHLELFPEGIFLSLEDAIKTYRISVFQESLWEDLLFPLFTNGAGDYYLFDMNVESETKGMILLYAPSLLLAENPQTIFDSLESFINTVLECYKQKAFKIIDNDGYIDIDYELREQIAKDNNPNSVFWKNS
jgi:hypothetical protein